MRAAAPRVPRGPAAAAAVLLAVPVVLSFLAGGFFDGPRLAALAAVAVVTAALALTTPARELLPTRAAGRAALAGLLGLAAWTWASRGRSPLPDVAGDDAERVLLYAGALVAGSIAWRHRGLARLAEPAVAAGLLAVVLYGLAGRWLPGVVVLEATQSAGGRLEQPLTYWNAMGLVAALAGVLCVRLAGDTERAPALRTAAAAALPPLLTGVYLSFSRGALVALAAGLVVLVVCAATRSQVRAVAVALATGAVAVGTAALLPAVRGLEGTAGAREQQGLVGLAVTLACVVAAVALTRRALRVDRARGAGAFRVPAAARWGAALLVVLAVAGPVVAGRDSATGGDASPAFGASSERFASVSSNRHAYWRVAVASFREHPIVGVGPGAFGTEWLRERPFPEAARDAHSLELETLAELGLVGFALLGLALGGVAASALTVQRRDPGLGAGLAAGLVVWATHSALDWDWELPAATLPALTLAAVLVARAEAPAA